jgi:hypothetical protein
VGSFHGTFLDSTKIRIDKVYKFKEFDKPLLSASSLTKYGFSFNFRAQELVIRTPAGKMLHAYKCGPMYKPILKILNQGNALRTTKTTQDTHCIFGRPSEKTVKAIEKHYKIENKRKLEVCTSCKMGKAKHTPFKSVEEKPINAMEVVSADICGPINPPSLSGGRYLLVVVDHASGLINLDV